MNRLQRRRAASNRSGASPSGPPQGALGRALAHHKAGRLAEAEPLYVEAVSRDPSNADAVHLLGVLATQTGRGEAGAALTAKAVSMKPRIAPYHSSHGNALRLLGRADAAAASFRSALDLDPSLPEAHGNLGLALMDMGAFGDAAAAFRTALALRPDLAEVHNNLGTALKLQGRLDEAAACLADAMSIRPGYAEACSNMGAVLSEMGSPCEAEVYFRRAVSLAPSLADAHFNLGTVLLSQGAMSEGWEEFEWRWATPQMASLRRPFPDPCWRGGPGGGGRLLIHAEQGFGDTIQFCRYVPMAATLGWEVVLEAQPSLFRLLGSLGGVSALVAAGKSLPPFDAHCPMLSLPRAFGTVPTTVPASLPYLTADPAAIAVWRGRLDALAPRGPRVGLAWAGSSRAGSPAAAVVDRRRSLSLESLRGVFDGCGATLVSLQKDGGTPPAGLPMIDLMDLVSDFANTAALVSCLDLVVSVDTAVAHLAGALGRPVWLLDRFDPCWRWLHGSEASPWYPSMRIYRQPAPSDWRTPLQRVADDLRALARGAPA